MLNITGAIEGREDRLLGLGLSAANVHRLMEGQPIVVRPEQLEQMGLAGGPIGEVMIFYGKTEQDLLIELRKAALITDDSIVIDPTKEGGA